MILYDTPAIDAFGLLGAIDERRSAEFRQQAALHGVEIKADGQVRTRGKTGLRTFHDQVARGARRGH